MSFALNTLTKDPDETRLYTMDWSLRLAGITINASSWVVPAGLTVVGDYISTRANKTSIMLSGGTSGNTYVLINTITTSSNETLQRSANLQVTNL